MDARIKQIKQIQPKSPEAFLFLLRTVLEIAFSNKLNYLEIKYRKAGDSKVHSTSITT